MKVPLFRPYYDEREANAIARVLKTGWTGMGPETEKFEKEFSQYTGHSYGIGTNSCTSALTIALKCMGVGPGDEVILPSMTFVSTAHAVVYCGATPVFCDILPETLDVDWVSVSRRITKKTKVIIAVNYAGLPQQQKSHFAGIPILFDNAHAAGMNYKSQLSSTACWSFHSVKNLSCGDGGMITTDDPEIAKRAKKLRWMGIDKSTWDRTDEKQYSWDYTCDEIGFKSHMNDLTAAIGRVQLSKLKSMQFQRTSLAETYQFYLAALQKDGKLKLPAWSPYHSWHLFVIQTDQRNSLSGFLKEKGIQTGVHYRPIDHYKCYGAPKSAQLVADYTWTQILSLPIGATHTNEEIQYVISSIKEFFEA